MRAGSKLNYHEHYLHWRRKRGVGGGVQGGGGTRPFFIGGGGGAMVCLCPPPPPPPHTHTLLTPHFYFPFELYVYITLTNNYLAFFIYQLIILWTILINWHRWLLLNNHISKYNSIILVLYRRYINYVSVCPSPTHPSSPTFWHLPTPLTCFHLMLSMSPCVCHASLADPQTDVVPVELSWHEGYPTPAPALCLLAVQSYKTEFGVISLKS